METRESFGKYQLIRQLASSGLAEMYVARDKGRATFERLVVIKRLMPHLTRLPFVVDRFLSEARTTAALSHPNIVRVDDVVEGPDDRYYVTEHVDGATLRDCVKIVGLQGGVMPIDCVVSIGIELCAGLAYAHEHRDPTGGFMVNRNVSPLNVMLSYDGAIKLGHFGLEGTLGYMSPEQARCDAVDARSDLFSLGVVLYEITTGQRLFGDQEPDEVILARIDRCEIMPPSQHRPSYPRALEDIILRALQRDRSQRYQSARDMQHDLETALWAKRPANATSLVGELVRQALLDSTSQGAPMFFEEARTTANRQLSPEVMAAAGIRPESTAA
jgi:serine/threonine protein kinase